MPIDTTAKALRRLWRGLNHPNAAVALEADNLLVRTPGHGALWPAGSRQLVTWQVAGVLGHPVDIELVTVDGGRARTAAVLARGLDPKDLRARVTVPDVRGGTYRVLVTSADPLDAYSARITVTED